MRVTHQRESPYQALIKSRLFLRTSSHLFWSEEYVWNYSETIAHCSCIQFYKNLVKSKVLDSQASRWVWLVEALFLSIVVCFTYLSSYLNNHSEQVARTTLPSASFQGWLHELVWHTRVSSLIVILQPAKLTCIPNISTRHFGYYFGLRKGLPPLPPMEKVEMTSLARNVCFRHAPACFVSDEDKYFKLNISLLYQGIIS